MEAKIFVTFRIKEGLSFVKGKSAIKYEVFLVFYYFKDLPLSFEVQTACVTDSAKLIIQFLKISLGTFEMLSTSLVLLGSILRFF